MKYTLIFLFTPFISFANIQIISTFSILTDITEQLVTRNVMIHGLSPRGVDPHNYKPTSHDLMKASQAQLFVYFGNGIDHEAYKMVIKATPQVQLCQAFTHDKNTGLDPHAWQSPLEGIKIIENLSVCLKKQFPLDESNIEQNFIKIKNELQSLFDHYQRQFKSLPESNKKILTSHQAFGYLARDFKLQAYSVMGADSHHEPSAQKIQKLVDLINHEKIKVLFPESSYLPTSLKRLTTLTSIQVGPALLSDSLPSDLKTAKNYQAYLKYNLEQIYQTLRKSNP